MAPVVPTATIPLSSVRLVSFCSYPSLRLQGDPRRRSKGHPGVWPRDGTGKGDSCLSKEKEGGVMGVAWPEHPWEQ
ncbi:MAG: hypothetical protein MJE68_02590 [Proteobacteria bacterium]|nr:hypothetical protein [Pseudomonadota bacterium]